MNSKQKDWQTNWVGKKLKGEKCTFVVQRYLGQGGNGIVYEIKQIQAINTNVTIDFSNKNCVVKILKDKFNDKNDKRYQRFEKEINSVKMCQNSIPGMMRILDYKISSNEQQPPYYLMFKADPFLSKCSDMKMSLKLDYLFDIGETLQKLHDFRTGYALSISALKGQ